MSSNLAVEEPMAADPAKNQGGDELSEESSAVKSTEEVQIRGSSETIIEEQTTVVVTEMKVELLGGELGSEDKSTGGLQGDDLLEVSLKKDHIHVESSAVGGEEEGNDPTEISLHDLTGGLDIDGKPTGEDVEEVVMEASVENETDLSRSLTEVAGESKDGLSDSHSDEQIQAAKSGPTGTTREQTELEGIQEDKIAEVTQEYMSEKELGEKLDNERSIDGDKTRDNLEDQIEVEEIKNVIPVEKVIMACDTMQLMEEGAENFSANAAIAGQLAEVAEKSNDTTNKPDVDNGPIVEENEEVVKKATSDSAIELMDGAHLVELSVAEDVQVVGVAELMDIDGTAISEPMEKESRKEAGGNNQELEAEVSAGKENSGARSEDKEKKPASSLEENNIAHGVTHTDGKEAVVYHRREKHHTTKSATLSPEPQKEETISGEMHITYNIPSVEKDGFAISDLVWGKVKSHPWWPGVIINPSDGSNLAMKYQKRDAFLVAYFGDKTFAWCDESQLKPFFPNFSHFEKQASSDAFSNAVRSVLVEVSRRFEVGTICSCLDEMSFAKEYPKLENAGVRQGFVNCAVDRSELVNYFNPKGLVDFIKDLALLPTKVTTDKLECVMITSQVKAFYQSKGYSVPPRYQTFGPLEDYIEPVIILDESEKLPENSVIQVETPLAVVPPALTPSLNTPLELGVVEKPKKKRGRPPKKKKEELDIEVQKPLSELVHKKAHSKLANGSQSNSKLERATTDEEDSASPLPWKKRKEVVGADLVEQENQAQTPRSSGFGISFKIGECISRAASRLTGSSSSPLISTPKFDSADFDVLSDEETPMPTTNEEKRVRRRRLKKYHYSDPKDVHSQLCLLAIGPSKEHGFMGTVINYFTEVRNFIVDPPPSAETVHLPEKVKSRRGRKRKVDLPQTPSHEVVIPTDHMQDSYWSDMILCGQTEEPSSWVKQQKRRVSIETKHLKLTPGGPDAKRAMAVAEAAAKRPIIRVEEKRLDECNPTALLLSFGTRYGMVPSEMDIVRIFSRYGPLKEWQMGILEGTTNRVWIVFKRRADAEMAFSSLRKQNVFGPSLLSYRLVYEVPEKSEREKKVELPNGEQHNSFKLLAVQEETVDLPSIPHGCGATFAVPSNVKGVDADEMLVDPLSNVEASDVAKSHNVDEIEIDSLSNFESVDAVVLSINPSSDVEILDVAQGDGMNKVPVDPLGNVEDGDVDAMSIDPSSTIQDAMSIDPSSTVQVEAIVSEALISTAKNSVNSSSNMLVDTIPRISVDHFSTVQNEDANENLPDPSNTTKAEAVNEAVVEPPVFEHVEAFEGISVPPSSTGLDEGAGEVCLNMSNTVHDAAVNEVLADESGTMQDDGVVVEPIDLPSTEQDEVTVAKCTSCSGQGVAVAMVSVNQPDPVQDSEIVIPESNTMSSQNYGQTDPSGILHSDIVSNISSVPASAGEGKVVVEVPVERTSTEEREEVGVILVETINTKQCEVVGKRRIELVSIEEGEVVREIQSATANTEQGEVVDVMPTEVVSIEEGEVAGEIQTTSTEQGKVDGEVPIEPARNEQGIEYGEMLEPSSIAEGGAVGKMSVEPASTSQSKVVGEVPIEASSIEQGEVTVEFPVDPANSTQGKIVGEVRVELPGMEQGEATIELPDGLSSTAYGEVVGEIPVKPSGTEQVEDGNVQVGPASTKQDSGRPVEALRTEEGEVVGEMSLELTTAEQQEVGEVPVEPSITEQGEATAEVSINPSSIEQEEVGEDPVEP